MTKEISVSSILQLFFNNIFSLLAVFIIAFMLSYFFSSDLLEKKYLITSHIEIGKVDDERISSAGAVLNSINSSSFDKILKENYATSEGSSYRVTIKELGKEEDSQLEVFIKSNHPDGGFQMQHSLLSMIRDLEANVYENFIQEFTDRIIYSKKIIELYKKELKIQPDLSKLDKLDNPPPFPVSNESFNSFVAYLKISEERMYQQHKINTKEVEIAESILERETEIISLQRMIKNASRSSYLTSPKAQDIESYSYPNTRTHLGFGVLLSLFFVIFLLYREFKKFSS